MLAMVARIHDPHPIDAHLAVQLRRRRLELGLSQQDLATAIGVTFQQVQKYERGTNRLSAARLHLAATALRTPLSHFFKGLPDGLDAGAAPGSAKLEPPMLTAQGIEIAQLVPEMPPVVRRAFIALARALALSGSEAAMDRTADA